MAAIACSKMIHLKDSVNLSPKIVKYFNLDRFSNCEKLNYYFRKLNRVDIKEEK